MTAEKTVDRLSLLQFCLHQKEDDVDEEEEKRIVHARQTSTK
jgi:hypothetical protein